MKTFLTVLGIILVVLLVLVVALYFFGKKAQKKQATTQAQMEAAAQSVTMLIIDKKRMKLKDAGLPSMVLENTPKLLRGSKLPIVKAKIGPRVMSLVCDQKIFDDVPVKKEVKATVSGIYITEVKGLRGPIESNGKKKKKGFMARMRNKAEENLNKQNNTGKKNKK